MYTVILQLNSSMPQQLDFIKYTEAGTRYCFSNMLQVQTISLLCHDSTLF